MTTAASAKCPCPGGLCRAGWSGIETMREADLRSSIRDHRRLRGDRPTRHAAGSTLSDRVGDRDAPRRWILLANQPERILGPERTVVRAATPDLAARSSAARRRRRCTCAAAVRAWRMADTVVPKSIIAPARLRRGRSGPSSVAVLRGATNKPARQKQPCAWQSSIGCRAMSFFDTQLHRNPV
jgi:hypothetical protein